MQLNRLQVIGRVAVVRPLLVLLLAAPGLLWAGDEAASPWVDRVLKVPYAHASPPDQPRLQLLYQDYERLGLGTTCMGGPMTIGSRPFKRGLGTHANSRIRVFSPDPIAKFTALAGVENNSITNPQGQPIGSVVFVVMAGNRELFRSKLLLAGKDAEKVDVDVGGAKVLDLLATDGGNGSPCDWADWADAAIVTAGGKTVPLDKMPQGVVPIGATRYPFSFLYDGKPSDTLLESWEGTALARQRDSREVSTVQWVERTSGLAVTWEITRFPGDNAVDWVLYFENTGKADTALIENVQPLDLNVETPLPNGGPYLLHRTRGGTADPQQFEPSLLVVDAKHPQTLDAGHGRSSGKDLPFFKIQTGLGSIIVAVGWSGYWKSVLECQDNKHLHMSAGMDKTRFRLHPGEKVRSPRILVMHWPGDTLESNARFRQLLYKHYAAKRDGKIPLPIPFCNTCFTRGGLWLNECNAENQISLINAYARLGLEALLTDAGWFTGGWPAGAGNWDPRKDAYPKGMDPVALAAKQRGMIYGLWFEPERVVAGTAVQKEHPQWCLKSVPGAQGTYLLNFGLSEVQDYFFNIVKGFMELPGFRVYRQDFNMDPRPYWTFNDAPDRQGMTEMKYIAGLYAYWDRLASTWPDSLREECASGGHRIDLETIQRLHVAQKTDYWFDDDVDQAALWGASQYLPNNCIVAHLNNLDDYSFRSTMASSLCLGWIADAPEFNAARGKKLLAKYLEVRHLLVGSWYPLLPYSRDPTQWMAVQYHRSDLGEGLVLTFRRRESPYNSVQVSLHGLEPGATYELSYDSGGQKVRASGKDLMVELVLTLPKKRSSELICYRRAPAERQR
jgi:alpha-galactosidase